MKTRRIFLFFTCFVLPLANLLAQSIKGKITDGYGDPMIGATVVLEGTERNAIAGMDGSYHLKNVQAGDYTIVISYVGFQTIKEPLSVNDDGFLKNFTMSEVSVELGEVLVMSEAAKGSDAQARNIEKSSPNTLNVVSAKSIELSPDITVAQIIQRVSGMSVERNENGDPQHAIIRGMNKRYNYTLVNGIKIPSPDDKNRYVPLDIFPASMLERLEVHKTLTPAMEGDAIGGVMNMVMKSAPDEFFIDTDFQLGYNQINLERGFWDYNRSSVNRLSPYEQFGSAHQADIGNFSTANLVPRNSLPLPDLLGSITIGNRFFDNKLGVMVGGSIQNTYRGTDSDWYDVNIGRTGSGLVALDDFQERQSSTLQSRYAAHARLDYTINQNHNIGLYAGQFQFNSFHARDITETTVDGRNFDPENGNVLFKNQVRTRSTFQSISNVTLQGEHKLTKTFDVDWSAAYSLASNDRPDNLGFTTIRELRNFEDIPALVDRRNTRRWEKHSDEDISLYWNARWKPFGSNSSTLFQFGGLFRDRYRDSFFNRYTFDPVPLTQEKGRDWETLDEVAFRVNNPRGNTSDPLNFSSYEQILAFYGQAYFEVGSTEITAGLRSEETLQGYQSKRPLTGFAPNGQQNYIDLLPSVNIKHKLNRTDAVRASYFRAVNRPGFFEIVDFILFEDEDFNQAGNPDLQRALADNIDFRFERFPNSTDQFMVGVFYKHIQDPIETVFTRVNTNNPVTGGNRVLRPENLGLARNFGLELDYTKYFNKFGVRFNYTFTNSRITTDKAELVREDAENESSDLVVVSKSQIRPLQGQADHIANLSLLYKDIPKGWDVQLSAVYVGERIELVSPFYENDHWSKAITILDLSVEKKIKENFVVFTKINNLLNSPYQLYVKNGRNRPDEQFRYQDRDDETFLRRDAFWQSYRIGLRYKFNAL